MKVSEACNSYFTIKDNVINCRKNSCTTNCLIALKIISYVVVIFPIIFAITLGISTLAERVCNKTELSVGDFRTKAAAENSRIRPKPDDTKVDLNANSSKSSKVELSDVLSAYEPRYAPQANIENLHAYSKSEDFKRHAKTAHVYYNAGQVTEEDALRIIFQREPTNIAMGRNQYNKEQLKKIFGYECGVYNEVGAQKADGTLFKDLPNTAAVYSELIYGILQVARKKGKLPVFLCQLQLWILLANLTTNII